MFAFECLVLIWSSLTCHFCSLRVSTSHKVFCVITIQEMGVYRVFQLDFVSHGQSNVEKKSKQFTCSYKSIKLDIHATSQTYRVTLTRTWFPYLTRVTSCFWYFNAARTEIQEDTLRMTHWGTSRYFGYFEVLLGTFRHFQGTLRILWIRWGTFVSESEFFT